MTGGRIEVRGRHVYVSSDLPSFCSLSPLVCRHRGDSSSVEINDFERRPDTRNPTVTLIVPYFMLNRTELQGECSAKEVSQTKGETSSTVQIGREDQTFGGA